MHMQLKIQLILNYPCRGALPTVQTMESSQDFQEPALALMKKYLPEYLQNILVASGYEKLETIAKINLPTDVDEMLEYIKESFTDLSKYVLYCYIHI